MEKIENIPHKDKTDEELVKLTLKDQDFFLYLIKRYETKLLKYILKISNLDVDSSEDILQDVFIRVYRNLNDFDQKLKFSSWIYRITHNQVISNFRKIKARPQNILSGSEIQKQELENLISDLDIEKEIDQDFLRKNIFKILNNIDYKYKEILILKFLEEKNYKEISDILKKPMGTIATLINRAKKSFHQEIKKYKNI